jgi:hypothetical protein
MSIKFKKLVWEQVDSGLIARTSIAEFLLYFEKPTSERGFWVLTIQAIGVKEKYWLNTAWECQARAQSWLEHQLTQFIETSENAAQ